MSKVLNTGYIISDGDYNMLRSLYEATIAGGTAIDESFDSWATSKCNEMNHNRESSPPPPRKVCKKTKREYEPSAREERIIHGDPAEESISESQQFVPKPVHYMETTEQTIDRARGFSPGRKLLTKQQFTDA